jgi:ubiquitin-like-conjugating enzyme ATG10
MDSNTDIKQFPYLDKAEFSEACHHLDRRYCQATLGPLRRRWKLRLCTALDMTFSLDGGYATYVQITRPLEADTSHDELSLDLDKFSISKDEDALAMGEQEMMDAEDADEVIRP